MRYSLPIVRFFCASNIFFNDLSCAKKLYRAVFSDHCVIMIMAFLQRGHSTDVGAKVSLSGFNHLMRENHDKVVSIPLRENEVFYA